MVFFSILSLSLAATGITFFACAKKVIKEYPQGAPRTHRKKKALRVPKVTYKFYSAAELASLKQSSRLLCKIYTQLWPIISTRAGIGLGDS